MPATITLYESDKHHIKYDTAIAVAEVLKIDRSRLLDAYTSFVDYPCGVLLKEARSKVSMNQMQFSSEIGVARVPIPNGNAEPAIRAAKSIEKFWLLLIGFKSTWMS